MVSSNSNLNRFSGDRKRHPRRTSGQKRSVLGHRTVAPAAGSSSQNFTGRQRIVLETNKARDKAEVLLAGLINAQRAVDRQDPRSGAGRIISSASMDRAISATKRLIATLNDQLKSAEDDLGDSDLSVLDEIDLITPA